ncbi:MAG: serine--tRNA ligase [Candidatus Aenigmarchaeota archaeon]|nr:serine--tRNA ligase [Candidatus Aenigmarchaeota archaeon]
MIDIRLIRENPEIVINDLKKRNDAEKQKLLEKIIKDDARLRELTQQADELKHKRNMVTEQIAEMKRKAQDASKKIAEMVNVASTIRSYDQETENLRIDVQNNLMRLPNILHESVPQGIGEEGNVVIREHGKTPNKKFPIKDHIDLGLQSGLVDTERAAKISGSRFYFLKGSLAVMEMALMRYAVDILTKKKFQLVLPPYLMKTEPYKGVIEFEAFQDVLYKVEGENLHLISTSEHPLTAMHMDETLLKEKLPLKYAGFSVNFRKEAGAHGKDTKGIFRVHQFGKVEQVVICDASESWKWHEQLLKNAEEIIKSLRLPYRIVNICTGDIGTVAAKKYDIEVWMPAQEKYREVVSCSNCTDYQARRLNIKTREKEGAAPSGFVHTLNSTAVTDRALVAIMENFQTKEGNIIVPKPLVKYTGFKEVGKTG